MRATIAVAVALALLGGAGAAEAKTYCYLAKEVAYPPDPLDATHPEHDPWDIKSLDVAGDAKRLTGVMRVADLRNEGPLANQEGGRYRIYFSVNPEVHFFFYAEIGEGVADFALYSDTKGWLAPEDEQAGVFVHPDGPVRVATAAGVVDRKANEIRMTVPLSVFEGRVRRGTKLYGFGGNSSRQTLRRDKTLPPGWSSEYVMGEHEDGVSAARGVTYPVGAPSCVRVGR